MLGLTLGAAWAAIEPPDDPREVAIAIDILKNSKASEDDKLSALTSFTKTTNLTDDAFWTLLTTAGDANQPDAVRITSLARLSGSIAYVLPTDVERGEHTVALMMSDRFKAAFLAMDNDRLPEFRAKWLYFFGAVTLNIPPRLTKPLGPIFLSMLLSSLDTEKDATAMNEGLWSLNQLLEIKLIAIDQAAPSLRRIVTADPDEGIRETAKDMLFSRGGLSSR